MKFKLVLLFFSLILLSCSSNDEPVIEVIAEIILNEEYEVEFDLDGISLISERFDYEEYLDLNNDEILKIKELDLKEIEIKFDDFSGDSGGFDFEVKFGKDFENLPFKVEFKIEDIKNFISNNEKISLSNHIDIKEVSQMFFDEEVLYFLGIVETINVLPIPSKMLVKLKIVLNAEITD
tara:strand:- start:72 stop:608 length:537 start_codon:yes stop_codon:yes gene_type:complete